jgi:UDP-N-acetylmuramate dehydrogenase
MLKIVENPNTKELTSMKVAGGGVKKLVNIESLEEFQEFISSNKDEKIMTIGEGTNTIFVNENPDLVLVKLNMSNIPPSFKGVKGDFELLKVDAGVNWDLFVQKYIELGGVGIEALSIIPGTVGAGPVQNIGAYGQEISNFIESIDVYDFEKKEFKTLSNSECKFEYRSSIFKKQPGRFIILSVSFKLLKGEIKIPNYKDVVNYFNLSGKISSTEDLWKEPVAQNTDDTKVTTSQIREAIISIRRLKFPKVEDIPNAGSFFKNAIVKEDDFKKIKEMFPEIPVYKTTDPKFIKLPTGYILERLGYRNFNPGFKNGNFGFYKNHALMIISNGEGEKNEFLEFVKNVKQKVLDATGIVLEEEVNLI